MMQEGQAVAEALGVRFKITLEQRLAGAEAMGAHKTSMLQDVEAGRALELEAVVGAVIALGRISGTPTPTIEAIYAATSLLSRPLLAQRSGCLCVADCAAPLSGLNRPPDTPPARPGRRAVAQPAHGLKCARFPAHSHSQRRPVRRRQTAPPAASSRPAISAAR